MHKLITQSTSLAEACQEKLQKTCRNQEKPHNQDISQKKKASVFDGSFKFLYVKVTMIQHTRNNLKLISDHVKKNLYNPTQSYEYGKALCKEGIYEKMKDFSYFFRKVSAFMISGCLTYGEKFNPYKDSIATSVGCKVKTVERALNKMKELGLISWESGQRDRKANTYFLAPIFKHKRAKHYLWLLFRGFWFNLVESKCRTVFKKIIYTYRKLIKIPKKLVEKYSIFRRGVPPEKNLSSCEAPTTFLPNKKEKVVLCEHIHKYDTICHKCACNKNAFFSCSLLRLAGITKLNSLSNTSPQDGPHKWQPRLHGNHKRVI